MKRHRKRLLSIAALALGLVAFLLIRNREPRYQGKTISEWADIGLKATDSVPWDEPNVLTASNAIHQIGEESFPWFRSCYPRRSGLWAWLMSQMQSIPITQSAAASYTALRSERLSFALYSLGESAIPLVPELASVDYLYPGYFISAIGPRALPALTSMLTNSAPNADTTVALSYVRHWGEKASAAGPALWQAIGHGRIPTQESSWFHALAATGYRGDEFTQLLLTRLQIPMRNADDNAEDIYTLSLMPHAGPAALVTLLNHPSAQVQRRAMESLCHRWVRFQTPTNVVELPRFRISHVFGDESPWDKVVDESTRKALLEAPVSTRLRAVELASAHYAAQIALTSENSAHPALEVITTLATDDPDPQVSQAAANALERFHLLKGR